MRFDWTTPAALPPWPGPRIHAVRFFGGTVVGQPSRKFVFADTAIYRLRNSAAPPARQHAQRTHYRLGVCSDCLILMQGPPGPPEGRASR